MSICMRLLVLPGLLGAVLASTSLRADSGDVKGSHDYPGLPRIPGFIITDYTEDNPATYDFPVAHPTSLDADNVDTLRVKGHRYVIRYEVGSDDMQAPTLLQIQQYYEKLAKSEGFTVSKSGATRDVTETFHLSKGGHELWVYLDPSITIDILTIVEGGNSQILPPAPSAPPPPPPPLRSPIPPETPILTNDPLSTPGDNFNPAASTDITGPLPTSDDKSIPAAPAPVPKPLPAPPDESKLAPLPSISGDALYSSLMKKGRVVLPLTFLPGQPELDINSAPAIVGVAALLQKHPDLRLEIDGYTDNTGDPGSNQRLSAERAETVRSLLVADHIEGSRLEAVGLGGSQPVASNATQEGREKNRRIELALDTSPQPEPAPVIAEKPPDEQVPPEPPLPPEEPATNDSHTFHGNAPNGVNYYPSN